MRFRDVLSDTKRMALRELGYYERPKASAVRNDGERYGQ